MCNRKNFFEGVLPWSLWSPWRNDRPCLRELTVCTPAALREGTAETPENVREANGTKSARKGDPLEVMERVGAVDRPITSPLI